MRACLCGEYKCRCKSASVDQWGSSEPGRPNQPGKFEHSELCSWALLQRPGDEHLAVLSADTGGSGRVLNEELWWSTYDLYAFRRRSSGAMQGTSEDSTGERQA